MERRVTPNRAIEIRQADEDGGSTITGYAAVYYREGDESTEYKLRNGVVERIQPGAFNDVLEERQDVLALFNHDTNVLLGRTSAGTLRLEADEIGLRYEIDLPDTAAGRDVATSVKRGDLTGSSFGFRSPQSRMAWDRAGGLAVRSISKFGSVRDIGPVTQPAYKGTTAGLRSSEDDGSFEQEVEALESRPERNAEAKSRVAEACEKLLDLDKGNG